MNQIFILPMHMPRLLHSNCIVVSRELIFSSAGLCNVVLCHCEKFRDRHGRAIVEISTLFTFPFLDGYYSVYGSRRYDR